MEKANALCKELRKKAGLTMGQVAEEVGLDQANISCVEKGSVGVSKDFAERYAILFGEQYLDPLTDHLVRYDIGFALRDILKERGIRLIDLTKAFGVDRAFFEPLLYPSKSGRKKVLSMNELEELAFFLGVPISKFNPKKVILPRKPARHIEIRLQNKKEEKPEVKIPSYSYTVDGSGCVKATAQSTTAELKEQLSRYAEHIDDLEERNKKLAMENEKLSLSCQDYESRIKELTDDRHYALEQLKEAQKTSDGLRAANDVLKSNAEFDNHAIANDLKEALRRENLYKNMLMKLFLERYCSEMDLDFTDIDILFSN